MEQSGNVPELIATLVVAMAAIAALVIAVRFKPRQRIAEAAPPVPVPVPCRSRGLTELTDWERCHIETTKGKCPDCGDGTLLQGPEAGVCMNVLCGKCGAKFNLGFGFGQIVLAQRLAEPTAAAGVPEEAS